MPPFLPLKTTQFPDRNERLAGFAPGQIGIRVNNKQAYCPLEAKVYKLVFFPGLVICSGVA